MNNGGGILRKLTKQRSEFKAVIEIAMSRGPESSRLENVQQCVRVTVVINDYRRMPKALQTALPVFYEAINVLAKFVRQKIN